MGIQVEHWGNLLFKLETQDLDWCSRAGMAEAVRNLVCLPAYLDVPGFVTAFRRQKAQRNDAKKHTAELCPSQHDNIFIKTVNVGWLI